jgi:hypothetical protein
MKSEHFRAMPRYEKAAYVLSHLFVALGLVLSIALVVGQIAHVQF